MFEKGLTGNTVLHYHANIRKALDSAMKLDVIPSNPADKIERPKKNQYIADYYSLDELNTLFAKSKGDPLEIVILLASFYGLRRSEVLGLKWSAFDFVNDTITIKHKVIETMVDDITEYKDYICVNEIGKIFRPEYITDHFSILLKKQNLRHICFHRITTFMC